MDTKEGMRTREGRIFIWMSWNFKDSSLRMRPIDVFDEGVPPLVGRYTTRGATREGAMEETINARDIIGDALKDICNRRGVT
jgi:hypothetical protein